MGNKDTNNSMRKARFLIDTKNGKKKMGLKGSAVSKRKPQDTAERQHGKSHR
jgi:hypothetical protein